jgi:hypothetical protein
MLIIKQTPACCCCLQFGTAAHEIGHALGLIHEHSRPERSSYVYIRPGLINHIAYKIYPDSVVATYGMPYDVGSIMHYPIKASHYYFYYYYNNNNKSNNNRASRKLFTENKKE